MSSYLVAVVHAGLGEKDQAFAWLEKAFEERTYWLFFTRVDPRMDELSHDPRYQNLLQRMNFPD